MDCGVGSVASFWSGGYGVESSFGCNASSECGSCALFSYGSCLADGSGIEVSPVVVMDGEADVAAIFEGDAPKS